MADANHHPDCPRCKGEGFYLFKEGHGYYRDGSFGHNVWRDCTCDPWVSKERLPTPVNPAREGNFFK